MREYDECPKCGNKSRWRSGLKFDYEMICYKCFFTFDPDESWKEQEKERLYYNTFRE